METQPRLLRPGKFNNSRIVVYVVMDNESDALAAMSAIQALSGVVRVEYQAVKPQEIIPWDTSLVSDRYVFLIENASIGSFDCIVKALEHLPTNRIEIGKLPEAEIITIAGDLPGQYAVRKVLDSLGYVYTLTTCPATQRTRTAKSSQRSRSQGTT